MSLHPTLAEPTRVSELRRQWDECRSIRIAPFLDDDNARELLTYLRGEPYELRATEPSRFNYQYWELDGTPHEHECDHPLCATGRWLWDDGATWLSRLTGMGLGPPPDRKLVSTLYSKGCFLDAHSDCDGDRQLAFVLGLTEASPSGAGGQLEFLGFDDSRSWVDEVRAPGWNSLDIFDVTSHRFVHQVALIDEAYERRAVSGWFWAADADS